MEVFEISICYFINSCWSTYYVVYRPFVLAKYHKGGNDRDGLRSRRGRLVSASRVWSTGAS